MMEEVEKGRDRLDKVKALLVSPMSNWEKVRDQFPEYFDPFEAAKTEDGTYDIDQIDDSQIDWEVPTSEDQDEALSRWIAERESGSFTGADFE